MGEGGGRAVVEGEIPQSYFASSGARRFGLSL